MLEGLWLRYAAKFDPLGLRRGGGRLGAIEGIKFCHLATLYRNWAEPVYDSQGSLVGSQALTPDRLYAVAESLNLTIETKLTPDGQFGKLLANGSWTGCVGMVVRDEADVCTIGLAWTVARE